MSVPRQLALDLGHRSAFGRSNFLVSAANAEAVAWIDRWPDWPGHALAIAGPGGCGKTHLAHVFQERSGARMVSPGELARPDRLAGDGALAVDDAARADERALLHLWNLQRERGGSLLLTAARAPARWGVRLPDLASRLSAMPVAEVTAPDDALLAAVLVKQFADRQLAIAPEVVTFVATRLERSFAAAAAVARALDEAAMAQARAPSIPLAREVLALAADGNQEAKR